MADVETLKAKQELLAMPAVFGIAHHGPLSVAKLQRTAADRRGTGIRARAGEDHNIGANRCHIAAAADNPTVALRARKSVTRGSVIVDIAEVRE